MFIDDLIATSADLTKHLGTNPGPAAAGSRYREYDKLIRQAACYALDADTAVFLESLVPDMAATIATFSEIKLPHDIMCIEYPFAPVDTYRQRRHGYALDETKYVPKRAALFIRKDGDEIYVATCFNDEDGGAVLPAIEIPVSKMVPSANGDPMAARIRVEDVRSAYIPISMLHGGRLSDALSDNLPEIGLALAFVLFLTSPDNDTITGEDITPSAKLDNRRIKSDKAPLRPYRRIHLGDFGRMHLKALEEEAADGQGTRKAHFVRGHYMRSHEKLVWRRPHIRGVNADGSPPEPPRVEVRL